MASESDLRQTLKLVGHEFPKAGVEVLLVGGFAVNYYGYTRSTLDVDFMVMADDVYKVKEIMVGAGYTNWSIHDTVAFFQQPGASLRIDFLRVNQSTLQKLRNRSKRIKIGETYFDIPSLHDLIAMKLFAVQHGVTERRDKDLADIVHLSVNNELNPEHDLLPLCEKYANMEVYEQLCQRIKQINNR